MYTVYFIFFQVASAAVTRYGLSRGLLGLKYDQINYSYSDSDSDSGSHVSFCIRWFLVLERLIRDDLSCSMAWRSKPTENAAV